MRPYRDDTLEFIYLRHKGMTNPAKDWREEVQADLDNGNFNRICGNETLLKNYIQKTLENKAVIKGERRRIIEQIREEEGAHLIEREKQLKNIHTVELDAISCMSIEKFVVWSEHRKQRLNQAIDIINNKNE